MVKSWRLMALGAIALAATAGLYQWLGPGFGPRSETLTEIGVDNEPGLSLHNVTLEQPDKNGVLLWRVKAREVVYRSNQQVALVTGPDSELFQDGNVIYRVTADQGEIQNNGSVIFLRGHIVATGIKNGSVLRGQELEWHPKEDVLIVRRQITGTHPQMRASAEEAKVYNRQNRMELKGQVVANTVVKDPKTQPWLKLKAEKLVWRWDQEHIDTDQPIRVEQFKNQTLTNVVTGRWGGMDLAKQVVNLQEAVTMDLLELPLQLISTALEWRVADQQVQVNQALTVIHPREKVRITAQRGTMDLKAQAVVLSQQVVAVGERNQSRLSSDRLTWTVKTQDLLAEGQVHYQQVNPRLNLTGNRGLGRLQDKTFTVDGGPVVTEIQPP